MEDMDLNIDNYDYEDILKLFDIGIDFGENDLKRAKRKVLLMHPDKSGLDKRYFLFFSSAYKILYSVYQFREKANISEKSDIKNERTEYIAEKDEYNEAVIKSLQSSDKFRPEEFNKWFNELFDKVKLDNDYDNGGYGDWLKNSDDEVINQCSNKNEMNEAINKKKRDLRANAITKYNDINEFNSGGYGDLTNSKPEEYSSGMFSKLQFEDLKKAHNESVVPVTEEDYKPKYNSMEDLRIKRHEQNLVPLSERDATNYLNSNKSNENIVNSRRAFKLAKQNEESLKANKEFWANLKRLK